MKYQAPTKGPRESGLTARLMYNMVDDLVTRHITQEDIERTDKKYGNPTPEKLWEKDEIRSELEEFVISYLLDDLQPPLPDFEGVLTIENKLIRINEKNFKKYIAGLAGHYGSREQANEEISELFGKLTRRGQRLYDECKGIWELEGEESIIANARDAFGHIAQMYAMVELDMNGLGIVVPQS